MTENGNQETRQDQQANEPSRVSRRAFTRGAAAAAAVAGAAAAGAIGWTATREPEAHDPYSVSRTINAHRVGAVPHDPLDGAWDAHEPVVIPLMPQHVANPRLQHEDGFTERMWIRSLHDGNEVAFQLGWECDAAHDIEAISRFTDSVAVQFPVDPEMPTSAMMGQPGRPVHILQWRASWQREVEEGARQVRDAFPNVWSDLRPEDVFDEDAVTVYYPARHVGNIAAGQDRTSAVEEIISEGFGSITTHEQQRAEGSASFQDGQWTVVMTVPIQGSATQATFRPGERSLVAVALWDGGKGDRGARKQWGGWMRLELES